jgi:hypothetical protein
VVMNINTIEGYLNVQQYDFFNVYLDFIFYIERFCENISRKSYEVSLWATNEL